MRRAGLVAVALVLTVVACFVSSLVWPVFWQQTRSVDWPSVPGVVLRSRIATAMYSDKRGTRYSGVCSVDVSYQYQVEGRTYLSDRLRFSPLEKVTGTSFFSTPERSQVQRVVSAYPKGATVSVHYDPRDPQTALLQPGRTPLDWWFALASVAAMTLCGAAWTQAILGPAGERVAGMAVVVEGTQTRLLHDDTTPWTSGLSALGGGAALAALVSDICVYNGVFSPYELSPTWVWPVYLALFLLGILSAAWTFRSRALGRRDVVLDAQTISFPTSRGRKSVPREALTGCDVVAFVQGGRGSNNQTWSVRLTWTEHGEPWGADVYTNLSQAKATELVQWLRTRCGLASTAPDFVSVLGVRLLNKTADVDPRQAVALVLIVVTWVIWLVQREWGYLWLIAPGGVAVGLLQAARWRATGLRGLAAQNGWRYYERMSGAPEAAGLPPHFTVGAAPGERMVATEEGRNVLVVSEKPLVVVWDASPLTTTLAICLDHPSAPFRCSPSNPLAAAAQVLASTRTSAPLGFHDADRFGGLYRTVGMTSQELAAALPDVAVWLSARAGWDVTAWQQWLVCTRTLVGKQALLGTIEEVQSLANGVCASPAHVGTS